MTVWLYVVDDGEYVNVATVENGDVVDGDESFVRTGFPDGIPDDEREVAELFDGQSTVVSTDFDMDFDDPEQEEIQQRADSGNANSGAVSKDEPLRETDAWYQFDVQPGEIEALQAAIADDVADLYDAVLADESIQDAIERLAAAEGDDTTNGSDETEKSLSAVSRRLRELLSSLDVAEDIADAIREHTADEIAETVEDSLADADAPAGEQVDVEAIRGRLRDRDVGFANEFADRMAEDIRETVSEGWAEGRNSREIGQEIAEQGDITEGWQGAERIARQELHVAAGEARSEVAAELDKVEVWQTAGDNRVRDAHSQMDGLWKFSGDDWIVEYPERGVQKESTPGNSEPGIGCRCVTLLRDREEVDRDDYAGDGDLN